MIGFTELKISDISEGLFDGPHATPAPSDTGPVFLGIQNIKQRGGLELSQIRHINEKDWDKWTKRVTPKENDIVFTYEATLNLYAIIPKNLKCCLGRRMALIRVDHSKINFKYLYYYFFSPQWREVISQNILSGATVDRIPLTKFPNFPISIPNRRTQDSIANYLSKIDDLISNNEQRIASLEKLAQFLYKEWFVNFKFPDHEKVNLINSGHPDFGMIPDGWHVSKLGDIATIDWGDTTKTKSIYTDTGYTAYSASGADGKIPYFDFERDGIVLSAIGANCGATWFATGKWSCIKNTIKFWATNNDVPESFLFYASYGNDFFPKRGAAQPFISKGDCEIRPVLVPDSKRLKEFNEIAHPVLILIKNLQNQNLVLAKMRDLLLPKLISGEIEVSEITSENFTSIISDKAKTERTRL